MKRECKNCEWYRDNRCHLEPPKLVAPVPQPFEGACEDVYRDDFWDFPIVAPDSFCSFFKQREGE